MCENEWQKVVRLPEDGAEVPDQQRGLRERFETRMSVVTSNKSGILSRWLIKFQIKLTGGGDGQCQAEFTVLPENLNSGGSMHGGFTATVIDSFTTIALMTKDSPPGVTVDLYVRWLSAFQIKTTNKNWSGDYFFSYLKAAKEGDEVVIDAKTIKNGRTLAYLECEIRHKKDGSIIAKGGQTKFVGTKWCEASCSSKI